MLQRVHRTGFAFQAFGGGITVNRHNQAIAQFARVRQIGDMARVQNVEHAVGHHHFLATLTRGSDRYFQLIFTHHAKTGFGPATHRVFQLDR